MDISLDQIDLSTNDPEQLAAAFAALEAGEVPKPAEQAPDPAVPEVKKEEPATPETPEQHKAAEPEKAEGVANKSGTHIIPFSVLKSERERATRAETLLQEANAKLAALESQSKQGAKTGESARTEQQPDANAMSDDDLAALKEDFPTVYKAVMASMAAAKALEAQLKPVQESVQAVETERANTQQETVQDAIDATPKLAHIQATDEAAFELAKQFDATLRNQPAWANRPLSERFAKVTEMVEATLGEINVPGSTSQAPQISADDVKKAALAKAASAAKAKPAVPNSLSEFPAGTPAAQDEREAAEQLTPLQLAEKLGSMSPDQLDAYFQTL